MSHSEIRHFIEITTAENRKKFSKVSGNQVTTSEQDVRMRTAAQALLDYVGKVGPRSELVNNSNVDSDVMGSIPVDVKKFIKLKFRPFNSEIHSISKACLNYSKMF